MIYRLTKRVGKRIKSIDSYGRTINLRHMNGDKFKTIAGGIATIATCMLIIAQIWYLAIMPMVCRLT